MRWLTEISNSIKQRRIAKTNAYEMTDSRFERIESAVSSFQQPVFTVRPGDDGGVREAASLIEGLHRHEDLFIRPASLRWAEPPTHSFELWSAHPTDDEAGSDGPATRSNRRLTHNLIPGSDSAARTLQNQLYEDYPQSEIYQRTRAGPPLTRANAVAGARVKPLRHWCWPIRHIDIEGFTDANGNVVRDPFKTVLTKLTNGDATVMLQTLLRPIRQGFVSRYWLMRKAKQLESDNVVFVWEYPPDDVEKAAAGVLRDQMNASMWKYEMRVVAFAENDREAVRTVQNVCGGLNEYYEAHTQQGLYGDPVYRQPKVLTDEIDPFLDAVFNREWEGGYEARATTDELIGITHIAGPNVENEHIDRTEAAPGPPVPMGTPRFDFEAVGLSPHADMRLKQLAMMGDSEPGDAFWIGQGLRKGTEAGIFEEPFFVHVFDGGASGEGKTSDQKNLFKQVVDRGYGATVYDPKGDDGEDFVGLIPPERIANGDLVYLEIGSDRDYQVGFNLMEVPGNAEPGDARYIDALESLGDTLESVLPVASGTDDDSWGTRMSRVTRNAARGLGKLSGEFTFKDFHYMLDSTQSRQQYAHLLDAERVEHIDEYAERHLSGFDDETIEPLTGRSAQLIENDTAREIVSFQSGDGFSVDNAVADGKIVVVVDKTSGTKSTTAKLVTTALINRMWTSIQEQTHARDRPDPPRIGQFLDEFNEIANVNSGILDILSDSRSFGLTNIISCQDLSGQLGKDIANAVEGQTKTKITHNPNRKGDARLLADHHTDEFDMGDVMSTSPYTAITRTRTADDKRTKSYRVGMFPPIDEVARSAAHADLEIPEDADIPHPEEIVADEEEIERRIEDSIRRYGRPRGEEPPSAFREGDATSDADDADTSTPDGFDTLDAAEAIDDAILEYGETAIDLDRAAERLRWYLDMPDAHDGKLRDIIDRMLATDALVETVDGETVRYRPSDDIKEELHKQGSGDQTGGDVHHALVRHVRSLLVPLGARVTIVTQGGDRAPDFRVELPVDIPTNPAARDTALAEFREEYPELAAISPLGLDMRGEVEKSTGKTKPGITARHYADAIADEEACLFVVPPGDRSFEDWGRKVHEKLTDPPCVREETEQRRSYYRMGKLSTTDGTPVWRPRTGHNARWWLDKTTDEVVLSDDVGAEFTRIPASRFSSEGGLPRDLDLGECVAMSSSDVDDDEYQRAPQPFYRDETAVQSASPGSRSILIAGTGEREAALYDAGDVVGLSTLGDSDEGSSSLTLDEKLDSLQVDPEAAAPDE